MKMNIRLWFGVSVVIVAFVLAVPISREAVARAAREALQVVVTNFPDPMNVNVTNWPSPSGDTDKTTVLLGNQEVGAQALTPIPPLSEVEIASYTGAGTLRYVSMSSPTYVPFYEYAVLVIEVDDSVVAKGEFRFINEGNGWRTAALGRMEVVTPYSFQKGLKLYIGNSHPTNTIQAGLHAEIETD